MHLTVALVGEQPLPNLLPLYHYRPEAALLVASERTSALASRLAKLLGRRMQISVLITDAYDVPLIQQELAGYLDQNARRDTHLEFNLTGGTKPMSFAAYAIAQRRAAPVYYLQSEKRRSLIYRYCWEQGNLWADDPAHDEITAQIGLKDMLDAHLDRWHEVGAGYTAGSDFERALAEALQTDGRFSEVMVGVKTLDGQIDCDLMVRVGNQFGIIEAKTGNAGRGIKGIQQLNTARRVLGTYTAPFYAITVSPEPAQQEINTVTGITPISLPGYTGGIILNGTDRATFVEAVYQRLST